MGALSPRDTLPPTPGMFITRAFLSFVKRGIFFFTKKCFILLYKEVLCKALLTARLFNCEPYRRHCSFDLNISNMHPKDLSFRTDEIFPIFAKHKTPKHKRCRQFPTKMVQDRFQHQCIQMNWPPIG